MGKSKGHFTDYQKSRVYRTEVVIFSEHLTWDEVEEFFLKVIKSRFYRNMGGVRATRLIRSTGWGHYARQMLHEIHISHHSATKAVILHELAHLVTSDWYSWHGATFCSNYLKLVRRFMGDAEWKALKESFQQGNVRHTLNQKEKYL